MIAEFYAPTRDLSRAVLQHSDGHGERWLSIQPGTPVVYEDLIGAHPGSEPERISGHVARVELRLLAPEPRLIVWLQPGEAPTPWGPSPLRAMQLATSAGHDDRCWGEFDNAGGLTSTARWVRGTCRECGYAWEHDGQTGGTPPRPHPRRKP